MSVFATIGHYGKMIILFGKMSSSESLSSPGTESETERMTCFEKFGLQPYSLEPAIPKVPVRYGRNSMSDLANSSNAATNDVDGRIGNKTWCKCECSAPMETNIESVCCLEIPKICQPRFSGTLCLHICRSDPHFIPRYSMQKKSINYLISTHIWSFLNQNKSFISIKTSLYFCKHFTLLIMSSLYILRLLIFRNKSSWLRFSWIRETSSRRANLKICEFRNSRLI